MGGTGAEVGRKREIVSPPPGERPCFPAYQIVKEETPRVCGASRKRNTNRRRVGGGVELLVKIGRRLTAGAKSRPAGCRGSHSSRMARSSPQVSWEVLGVRHAVQRLSRRVFSRRGGGRLVASMTAARMVPGPGGDGRESGPEPQSFGVETFALFSD